MTTRSTVLARWVSSAAGASPAFSPPANACWIVKTISFRNSAVAAATVVFAISTKDGSVLVEATEQSVASGASITVQTWHMVMPSDQFYMTTTQPSTSAWVSGSQLPFP